jgi:hypothetical protein
MPQARTQTLKERPPVQNSLLASSSSSLLFFVSVGSIIEAYGAGI